MICTDETGTNTSRSAAQCTGIKSIKTFGCLSCVVEFLAYGRSEGDQVEEFPRLVTIKCLYKGCSKVFKGQRVNHSTSNYITHYKANHKAFNIQRLLINLDIESNTSDFEETSS
ncbi:hypothetical protein WAI453_012495 [Rhynchosporium graminicola]